MADDDHVQRDAAGFQDLIYATGMYGRQMPTFTTAPDEPLRAAAKKKMSETAFNYVNGGAGNNETVLANRMALRQWRIVPRMLRLINERSMNTTLFGQKHRSPIICAPIGVQSIFHPDAEPGCAEVAAELGVAYCASSAATHPVETIAKASDLGARDVEHEPLRWYQLYWTFDDEINASLLSRAKAAGYTALVVTLDTWKLAWRPADLDNAYLPFLVGEGVGNGFNDPVFRRRFAEASGGKKPEEDVASAAQLWLRTTYAPETHSWEELAKLRKVWGDELPILLKGVQHPGDAKKAWEVGMDGVIVSNHGGRQLDGAIGSLDAMVSVVDEIRALGQGSQRLQSKVGNREFAVLFDGGIRTGADVLKAMCLGADAVMVGRPWIYGLGINGKQGAKQVLQSIMADFDISMSNAGLSSLKECTRDMLQRIAYHGESVHL